MGLLDTFHFDQERYIRHLQGTYNDQLEKKHHRKVRQIITYHAAAGGGIGTAPATAGVSLVGSAYACRQVHILEKQKGLIENEMRRRGLPVPRERNRDRAAGATIGLVSLGIGHEFSQGIEHISGQAGSAFSEEALESSVATASHALPHAHHIGQVSLLIL
ncbi:hypothetical protein VKT23_014993 [Stygiomarasmius scandens]|uniref:Uncharacterized protein n=1 Tax=Marasmiellus scandens TaxID=2682957 RepID=A0ABR1J2B3_9AGAR